MLIARLHPQQPVPSVVRKPPELQVTISSAGRERLRAIQDLMRHRLPSGDPAAIIERALEVLHAELLKKKAAEVARTSGVEFHHLQPYASAS